MEHILKIISVEVVTHDVKCFRLEKPEQFVFIPGQATDLSINQPGWEAQTRPFTFTGLNTDPYLEFTIKRYDDHHGVTSKLHELNMGDELIVRDVWGAISYKGPGYFIAGGAGITPFIAIFRELYRGGQIKGNQLFFSNKTEADIIYETELRRILDNDLKLILTNETRSGYIQGYLDEAFIHENIADRSMHVYVCGPDKMITDIRDILEKAGIDSDSVVFEN